MMLSTNPFENDDDDDADADAVRGELAAPGAKTAGAEEAVSAAPGPPVLLVDAEEVIDPQVSFLVDARPHYPQVEKHITPHAEQQITLHADIGQANGNGIVSGEEPRRWFIIEWLGNFGQNALFLLAVLPLTLILSLEVILSLFTCCLLCRAHPAGPPTHYRLPYNMAFLAIICGQFLTGGSEIQRSEEAARDAREEDVEITRPEEDISEEIPSAPTLEDIEGMIEEPKTTFLLEARPGGQEEADAEHSGPTRGVPEVQREARPAWQWMRAILQNTVFLLVVLPVTFIVLLDIIFSAFTLCLLCRSAPKQTARHFRLMFNFAFFSNLFARCLYSRARNQPAPRKPTHPTHNKQLH